MADVLIPVGSPIGGVQIRKRLRDMGDGSWAEIVWIGSGGGGGGGGGGGEDGNALLMETGDALLLETGDALLLED